MLKNNKGFSLIELMVAVAIIAILATIAIPSYQGFQAKARQKEGLALLNAYYVAAQATFAETGYYTGDFVSTGFQPTGNLGYQVRAANGTDPMFGSFDDACIVTSNACNAVAMNFMTWNEIAPAGGGLGVAAPPAPAITDITFTTTAGGVVRSGGMADFWSIDQNKVLLNTQDGLLQ